MVILFLMVSLCGWAQTAPEAYRLYGKDGKPVAYADMVKDLAQQDADGDNDGIDENCVCYTVADK